MSYFSAYFKQRTGGHEVVKLIRWLRLSDISVSTNKVSDDLCDLGDIYFS